MFYKIGPVVLKIDTHLSDFREFEYKEICSADHIIEINLVDIYSFQSEPMSLLDIDQFKISKIAVNGQTVNWIFESKPNSMSFLIIDVNYENVIYFSKFGRKNRCFEDDLQNLLKLFVKCRLLIENNCILHASCISMNNEAIIFSAASGVGKSTRAKNFVDKLHATWISGDRPAIDYNKKIVYGVPWDGKEGIFVNKKSNLSCIFEIHRSKFTYVKRMQKQKVYSFLLHQLFIPMWDENLVEKVFESINYIINEIPFYELYCDQTTQATLEIYHIIKDKINTNIGDENMKLKDDFKIMHIGDDYMAIPTGKEAENFNGVVSLSEAAAYLLENMEVSKSEEEIVNLLVKEYDVDTETAKNDVNSILKTFKEIGLIEE